MTQMEECLNEGKIIEEWQDIIYNYFKEHYDSFVSSCRGGEKEEWFISGKGCFRFDTWTSPMCGFVLEYADSKKDVDLIRAEDIDQYPLLDYDSPENILKEMVEAIES